MKNFTFSIVLLYALSLNAQVAKNSDLFKTLTEKDSLLFTEGLNKCNIELIKSLVHEDFEFYHDKGGIDHSKSEFIETLKNGPCINSTIENRRTLKTESLEVFPLYTEKNELYGAVQSGTHHFGNSSPKFTHLWLLVEGQWKLSRVLSFNH